MFATRNENHTPSRQLYLNSLTDGLATLARLNPVRFHYTEDYLHEHPGCADKERFGIVAQEFQEVFPDYVSRDKEGNLSVDVSPITFYNTAATRELNQELVKKETKITELKLRLERLERLLDEKIGGAK